MTHIKASPSHLTTNFPTRSQLKALLVKVRQQLWITHQHVNFRVANFIISYNHEVEAPFAKVNYNSTQIKVSLLHLTAKLPIKPESMCAYSPPPKFKPGFLFRIWWWSQSGDQSQNKLANFGHILDMEVDEKNRILLYSWLPTGVGHKIQRFEKKNLQNLANFARLPSQIHQILQIFAKFSPNIFVHDFFRPKNWWKFSRKRNIGSNWQSICSNSSDDDFIGAGLGEMSYNCQSYKNRQFQTAS